MEAKEKIRGQIQSILNKHGDFEPFNDTDSLIYSGRIDSLNVLEIVGFLEQEFQFDISTLEFDESQFDSLNNIVALV